MPFWRHGYDTAGARVTPDAPFPRANLKAAKPTQLNALAVLQTARDGFKNCLNGTLQIVFFKPG